MECQRGLEIRSGGHQPEGQLLLISPDALSSHLEVLVGSVVCLLCVEAV